MQRYFILLRPDRRGRHYSFCWIWQGNCLECLDGVCQSAYGIVAKFSFCKSSAELTEDDFLQVEFFISAMYQHLKSFTSLPIVDTRKKMFLTKGVSFDKLPPTKDVLHFKTLRVLYQCMVWANSLVKEPKLPSVLDYGWQVVDEKLSFLWSTFPDVVKGCWDTFVKCNCKKSSCTKNCSCRKAGEVCTTLCGCSCYDA